MKIHNKFLILVLLNIKSIFAISETNFEDEYSKKVIPFYNEFSIGQFNGNNNIPIHYIKRTVQNERAALIILHGFSETSMKYRELLYDLSDLQFSYYLMDFRGMGFSGRMLQDKEKAHVKAFEDYLFDIKLFIDSIVNQENHNKLFLLAHSMGGGISAYFLEEYSDIFDAAILSCPMMTIKTQLPESINSPIAGFLVATGQGENYAPTQGKWKEYPPFEYNNLTQSEKRYRYWSSLVINHPEIRIGGSTNNWVYESYKATKKLRVNSCKIKIPYIIFQAGKDDWVKPEGHMKFVSGNKNGTILLFPESKHEVLMEKDETRNKAITAIREFFNKQLGN